jgi:glycosyltransferase involved in cell wall biosynthesis
MRVLIVCPSWGRACGVADYTRYLIEGFTNIGVHGHVVTDVAGLQAALAGGQFDLVHLQHEYSLFDGVLPGILQACAGRLPVIATVHTVTNSPGPAVQNRYLATFCQGIIVHSVHAHNMIANAGGVPLSLLMVTNQGCPDYRRTFADPAVVRAELGIPTGEFAVGFFGFAFPQKGIGPLVQALQQTGVWGFVQASDHWLAPGYLREVCQSVGIPVGGALDRIQAGRVTLSNRHLPFESVGRYMHAMDMIVLPYWSEPTVASTSAAVRAALATHRAVVTTQAAPFSDLTDEVLKIPDGSIAHIRGAIERLRDDHGLRLNLAEKARQYASRNRWEMVARRHIELYRQRGCGPKVPSSLDMVYNGHPDIIYDIPIQRERVRWLGENVTGRTAEMGCANGYITEQCGAVLGVDINPDRLAVARALRRGCTFEQRDITQKLPYSDTAFDTLLLPEVLQDIPFEQVPKVLNESVRIGRRLVITTPNAGKPNYDRHLVENPEHRWSVTPEKMQQLLAAIPKHAIPGATVKVDTSPGQDFVYATLQRL